MYIDAFSYFSEFVDVPQHHPPDVDQAEDVIHPDYDEVDEGLDRAKEDSLTTRTMMIPWLMVVCLHSTQVKLVRSYHIAREPAGHVVMSHSAAYYVYLHS